MDVTLAEAVQVGARRLLSASAHFYLYGGVPARLHSKTKRFFIIELPVEHGSTIRKYMIILSDGVAGGACFDIVKDGLGLRMVIILAVASAVRMIVERKGWAVELSELLPSKPA